MVYSELTEEIFSAYYACRKNKRNTLNALEFEVHLERNLFSLIDEIHSGCYIPGKSIAFIVNRPVKREVFAADFRDRVVHHWLIGKLNPLFESFFINDSYACRVAKGTHFGIKRIAQFIAECSDQYRVDTYILKLDIQGFFMHINRRLLHERLTAFISAYYKGDDIALLLSITQKIVFANPAQYCFIKGNRADWKGLPANKSLFFSPPDCGLPIGNLTSQVFANFYLHAMDVYITQSMGISYYGRYVDDFILIHRDKEVLKSVIPNLNRFLAEDLHLTLHPKKIFMQHYVRGVTFLGAVIKPGRIYIGNRTKGNFYQAIKRQNQCIKLRIPNDEEVKAFQSAMNSYLGLLRHYKTYRIRKKAIQSILSNSWNKYVVADEQFLKFSRVPL